MLILIVIAVAALALTDAWTITYTGSITHQVEISHYKANVNFRTGNIITIDICNSGTGSGQIVQV